MSSEWSRRFAAYVARKELVAWQAHIAGFGTERDLSARVSSPAEAERHVRGPAEAGSHVRGPAQAGRYVTGPAQAGRYMSGPLTPIGNDWSRVRFDGPFYASPSADAARPAVNLVFVQSRDGNTAAEDPADLGGGETDKHLIYEGLSRVHADAVLAGAGTVRGADLVLSVWHPVLVDLRRSLTKRRHPLQIVVSASGRLDIATNLLFNVPSLPVLIITSAEGQKALRHEIAERTWINCLVTGAALDLPAAFRQLRERHAITQISCVGGRTLATSLIDGGLVDDLYLTTAARKGGEPGTPFYTGNRLKQTVCVKKRERVPAYAATFEHFLIGTVQRSEYSSMST